MGLYPLCDGPNANARFVSNYGPGLSRLFADVIVGIIDLIGCTVGLLLAC